MRINKALTDKEENPIQVACYISQKNPNDPPLEIESGALTYRESNEEGERRRRGIVRIGDLLNFLEANDYTTSITEKVFGVAVTRPHIVIGML